MSRIVIVLVACTSVAHAQEAPAPSEPPATATGIMPAETTAVAPADTTKVAPPDLGDQGIGASLGVAFGGRTTAGGLRVAGHYLYQLAEQDWFDGTASFVFGGGDAECFRDRMDAVLCDHGLADGYAVELGANVRRFFGGNQQFYPFARAGIGLALVRFSDDGITGIALPLHLGGGLRVSVSEGVAVVGQAQLDVGLARFNNGPANEPQLGLNVSAGAEFRL